MGVLNMIGQRDQIKKIYSDYLHSSITEQLVKTANSLREFFLDEDDTDWEVLQSCIWEKVYSTSLESSKSTDSEANAIELGICQMNINMMITNQTGDDQLTDELLANHHHHHLGQQQQPQHQRLLRGASWTTPILANHLELSNALHVNKTQTHELFDGLSSILDMPDKPQQPQQSESIFFQNSGHHSLVMPTTINTFSTSVLNTPISTTSSSSRSPSGTTDSSMQAKAKKRLHITNIPFSYDENTLVQLFGEYGETIDAEVVKNERGSKGYGFITFLNSDDAEKAKRELNDKILNGRKISVNDATEKGTGSKPFVNKRPNQKRIPDIKSIPSKQALGNFSLQNSLAALGPCQIANQFVQMRPFNLSTMQPALYITPESLIQQIANGQSLSTSNRFNANGNGVSLLSIAGANDTSSFFLNQPTQISQQLFGNELFFNSQPVYDQILSYQNPQRTANNRYTPY